MKRLTLNRFKVLAKLAALGKPFRYMDARVHGVEGSAFLTQMRECGLAKRVGNSHYWELTDKAYREMSEVERLLEQVQ